MNATTASVERRIGLRGLFALHPGHGPAFELAEAARLALPLIAAAAVLLIFERSQRKAARDTGAARWRHGLWMAGDSVKNWIRAGLKLSGIAAE